MTPDLLHRTARLYGLQTIYLDGINKLRQAPTEAILCALRTLGAPVDRLDDLPDAYRDCRQALYQRVIEPVVVVWENETVKVKVRLPAQLAETRSSYRVVLENGETLEGELRDDPACQAVSHEVENIRYVRRQQLGPANVPLGYHKLYLRIGALDLKSYLFSAPAQAFTPEDHAVKRWGLFCPLYALRSERSWGAGDFSDLEQFSAFTAELGGHAVATLPMLASFLDEPFNPSPYAPVSRLFWNEFYLDLERIVELQDCSEARSIISTGFVTEVQSLCAAPLVEYRKSMALKRRVLEALARWLFSQNSQRRESLENYIATHPLAQDYAAFRAKTERERKSWPHWQPESRDGALRPEDFDEDAKRYHLYVQWQCAEQTAALREGASGCGAALYLDFPLGVNRDGYDVWRQRELFALDVNGGAPPDGLFVKGQNWGFPPIHPKNIREQGYRYYINCLRHHLRSAGMLRIDHVMGLHRAFWVPHGFAANDGVYVHYQAPEFYAILNLESHRHRVQIVGENLGTVPAYVNETMTRHHIRGIYVGQFGVNPDPSRAVDKIPENVVTSLNTHDTATFMGFWQAQDITDRVSLGLLDETQAEIERRYRAAQRQALVSFLRQGGFLDGETSEIAILKGWLTYLAGQNDEFLLVNLEDLWLEPAPQNVPGTWDERPNWQRKARHSFDDIRRMDALTKFLRTISDIHRPMS